MTPSHNGHEGGHDKNNQRRPLQGHLSRCSRSGGGNPQGVVVTKRGKPVARVVPMVNRPERIVGALKGDIEVIGDVVSPVGVTWKATKR